VEPGLERRGSPLGATFPGADGSGSYELSAAQIEEFHERGCLTGLDLLDPDQVAALLERLGAMGKRIQELEPELYEVETSWCERPDEVVLHFLGAWRVDELFHDLIFHPGATTPLAQLLDTPRLRFWHDQVFWKPPRHPGVVPWHQDYSYWTRTGPPAHVTMFIALDDMGPENGGLEYVPGSHRWGLLPLQDFGGDLNALEGALTAEQRAAFRPEPVRLRAGQASIHHSHMVHGSRANTSDQPRRAAVLNYMADGTRALDGAPLLRGVPPIPMGSPIEGDFFPVVLERQRS
jgi:ectoine hydroxylase-related dioxygenase (phytanoyl-CoA dioxygenase family)